MSKPTARIAATISATKLAELDKALIAARVKVGTFVSRSDLLVELIKRADLPKIAEELALREQM